ncbi:pyridoxal-dependent decarboxylase conserved domain-containing protein [Hirsutella rhossiliensis]|uniref:Glutamate decarboxylase n=1 Tax=Hirsutella rhossiliensis TaxID=111463 RepID=A0A9P8N4D4_9HYPO|nr:pyridoxal-dependent decarboxylase conserved domain-containing protein [Hirsutella rhossiliensis]KAH0966382.1 pyridoxal-dependent decarboxylase conserved domain-containing protein [Hirsutella rhossiliensis]
MVHLSAINHDHDPASSSSEPGPGTGNISWKLADKAQSLLALPRDAADEFSTSVCGSRFACEELPRNKMPEDQMPRDVAYRMIKDDLSLDNNPRLNLASFVTTYMEDEAEKLMTESMSKNFIDYEEYPRSADIQARCTNMIGDLFHAPSGSAVGTSTVGSSEAIMLAVLAMKRRWRQRREAGGKLPDGCRPNIVMSSAVQVCWEKAARYFEIDERYVYCTPERFVIDPREMVDLCDENTICCVLLLGTTYTGHYEDVKAVNDLLVERKLDVSLHVDAASGGFVAPFVMPDLEWDFRCEKVVSINVSGHKYGLVYPGVGWVLWRAPEYLPQDLVFNIDYLGAQQSSFTLNFSKGASQVIGQYYQLIRLGRRGYRAIMLNLTRTADFLADALQALGFVIMSERSGHGLPLVAFRFGPNTGAGPGAGAGRHYDEFALAHALRSRGWVVPAYTMAPHTNRLKMLRVVVREDFSRSLCDMLLDDIKLCLGMLDETDQETIKRQDEYIRTHMTASGRSKHSKHKAHAYKDEQHSLQGKTGKTHATC